MDFRHQEYILTKAAESVAVCGPSLTDTKEAHEKLSHKRGLCASREACELVIGSGLLQGPGAILSEEKAPELGLQFRRPDLKLL